MAAPKYFCLSDTTLLRTRGTQRASESQPACIPLWLPIHPLPGDAALLPGGQQLRWRKPQAKAIWKQHLTPACFEQLSGSFLALKKKNQARTWLLQHTVRGRREETSTSPCPLFPYPALGRGGQDDPAETKPHHGESPLGKLAIALPGGGRGAESRSRSPAAC